MLKWTSYGIPGFTPDVNQFIDDESGATSIEYGFIALGVALAIVAAVGLLGDALTSLYLSLWPVT